MIDEGGADRGIGRRSSSSTPCFRQKARNSSASSSSSSSISSTTTQSSSSGSSNASRGSHPADDGTSTCRAARNRPPAACTRVCGRRPPRSGGVDPVAHAPLPLASGFCSGRTSCGTACGSDASESLEGVTPGWAEIDEQPVECDAGVEDDGPAVDEAQGTHEHERQDTERAILEPTIPPPAYTANRPQAIMAGPTASCLSVPLVRKGISLPSAAPARSPTNKLMPPKTISRTATIFTCLGPFTRGWFSPAGAPSR